MTQNTYIAFDFPKATLNFQNTLLTVSATLMPLYVENCVDCLCVEPTVGFRIRHCNLHRGQDGKHNSISITSSKTSVDILLPLFIC